MNDIKKQKGSSIAIFIIVLYPLIRYSIEQLSIPFLFQYFLLLFANALFSFIKQPYLQTNQTDENNVTMQKYKNKSMKYNINQSSLTQNGGETNGFQAEGIYLNQTRQDQNSLIEFNNHMNQNNISMNNDEDQTIFFIDKSQIKNIYGNKNINQSQLVREFQLNKKNIKKCQSKSSILENSFHNNQIYFNQFKYNLNLTSTGIIILDKNKKLVYSNQQTKKIIKNSKNSCMIDEVSLILSLNLQNNNNVSQQDLKDKIQKQSSKNFLKNIKKKLSTHEKIKNLSEEQNNQENDKHQKVKQIQEQYDSTIKKQNKSSNHNAIEYNHFTNYKKAYSSEVNSSIYQSEILNKSLKIQKYNSQKDSNQIGQSSLTQSNTFGCNLSTNINLPDQNIKSSQIEKNQQNLNYMNNKKCLNKQEKSISLLQQSSYSFQFQNSSKILQCFLPCNINKIFNKNNLQIDDIIDFLMIFSVSPHNQQIKSDNQIQTKEESEECNTDLQQKYKDFSEISVNNINLSQVDDFDDEKESEHFENCMQKEFKYNQTKVNKNTKIKNICQNLQKVRVQNQDEVILKNLVKENQQKSKQTKNTYNYFIQNNFLHLTVKIEGDNQEKYENKIIEIKLSTMIQTEQDYEEKFVQIEISDITKLMKQIDKQSLDMYKNKILSSISHELRTPLNCSISMLELLTQNDEIPEILKQIFVTPAINSNYLLLNIINDILDLAQINYGKFSMQFSEFELSKIITECINLISMQALQKNLEIELDLDSNIPQIINSDQNRIRQVLLNLLSNALKFTQKGKITIRVSQKEESLILIDIEDTGCGIPEKNLMMITKRFGKKDFYNFEDLKNKSLLNTMGVGLGLTIANNLATGLGGNRKLQVSSIENVGTKFQFYIVNHPHNKIGCDFVQRSIFSQEIIKWQSISETSSKQQQNQQQQQQINIQYNQKIFNNNTITVHTNLSSPQSQANLNKKNLMKSEESFLQNKFVLQPIQSLIKFNTEILQNQNGIQSIQSQNNSFNYQKQEQASLVSQTQSFYEGGKSKKFQHQFQEQVQNCEKLCSNIDQQLYPQLFVTTETKTFDQNNTQKQLFENYFKSNSQVSLKNKNEITINEKCLESDQNINQQKSILTNPQNNNQDLHQNFHQIILENQNKNSLFQFPTIKSSIELSNKPNSDLKPHINLPSLNSSSLLQNNKENKALRQNNIKSVLYPKPGDNQVQCISLFKHSYQYNQQDEKQNKQKEIKEGQCDIIQQNEIQNIQIPNQFQFQKVSEKRSIKFSHTLPSQPYQQINQSSNTKQTNEFSINKKLQDIYLNQAIQNNENLDKLKQQNDELPDYLAQKNESITEGENTKTKPSDDQKKKNIPNMESIDMDQKNGEEKKQVNEISFQQNIKECNLNIQEIYSPKIPTQIHNIQLNINNYQKIYQQINQTKNNLNTFIIGNQDGTLGQILQNESKTENYNQTVKQQMQEYNQKRKCQCPNILIVDDNEFNIYALESRLKQYGFIIDKAISGIIAFQLVKKKFEGQINQQCCKCYPLIIMDIDMPIKNGYETTKDILSYYKQHNITQTPQISACSAYIQQSEQTKAIECGMHYYIKKPINKQNFEEVLFSMIKNIRID